MDGVGQERTGLAVDPAPVLPSGASAALASNGHVAALALRLEALLARRDLLVLASLVALAALLRLVDLPTRGTWDSDQGHDMLVLRALVRDGVVPLLGPPTSIGDVHHGAWYYYLLAPAAWLGGAAPEAVVTAIALGGVAAVGVTWWIGRALGGPIAGLVAGLAMAVSASAIEESTFIWNPNVIALSSGVAVAGAVRAWQTGRARWWVLAGIGLAVTMQAHVLGAVLLPAMVVFLVADWRRRGAARDEKRRVLLAALAWAPILALAFLPLAVNELTHDFSETRAALAYLRDGGEPPALSLPLRMTVIGLRIVSWPLAGLVTDAFAAAFVAALAVVAILVWRGRAGEPGLERPAVRWFAGTLAWSAVALAGAAASLATVTPGLPNDHYHAFLDPVVFVVTGLGAAGLARRGSGGGVLAAAGVVALVALNLAIRPPAVAPDGGWPAARDAAVRIARTVGDRPIALLGLPDFKSTEGVEFPLVHEGVQVVAEQGSSGALVLVCDSLFEEAIGAACGGAAEERFAGRPDRFVSLADHFALSNRTWVSVYLPRR